MEYTEEAIRELATTLHTQQQRLAGVEQQLRQINTARHRFLKKHFQLTRRVRIENFVVSTIEKLFKLRDAVSSSLTIAGTTIVGVTLGASIITVVVNQWGATVWTVGAGMLILAAMLMFCLPLWLPSRQRLADSQRNRRRIAESTCSLASAIGLEIRDCEQKIDDLNRQAVTLRQSIDYLQHKLSAPFIQLSRMNWRDLRGYDFEVYLEQLFRAHGFKVIRHGGAGDQGVDLIAACEGRRIAIQAKGYSGSVGNSAVQEVAAGRQVHGCNEAVVVTNSRFTKGAYECAHHNRVRLVDGDELRQLAGNQARF